MVSLQKLLSLAAIGSGVRASAPVVTDSPKGAKYSAEFEKGVVSGEIDFSSSSNGSVSVNVDLSGLPSVGGPYKYHVHQLPVPSDGNCNGTKLHLNPYNGNPNATQPNELEVGDLSGRHGVLTYTDSKVSYVDDYISLNEDNKAFIGGLSVVIHFSNDTRLACANITSNSSSSSSTVASAEENAGNLLTSSSMFLAGVSVITALLI
ncbi:uncharacterized protein PRCAT00000008001 [Priceomyces carsonii]|uniref:uncharacterized protein n=1 Tax=Priceomyces carsonii TaxID=28549 RepID=UPI002ED803AE|nr:unnamed protein product [Priceomyces carsonii]